MLKNLLLQALPWLAFAYENIALDKHAWQLYPFPHQNVGINVNASMAVDGRKTDRSFRGGQCTASANERHVAQWHVDLGAVLGIDHITIYYRTDNVPWGPLHPYVGRFLGYSVYISNTPEKEDGVLCFNDYFFTNETLPPEITNYCTHHGRYVIYYNNRTSSSIPPYYSKYAYNELCEFEVYGCSTSDHYGKDCNQPCPDHCNNNRCHIHTGNCFDCKDGYQGQKCEHRCSTSDHYGKDCNQACPDHCNNNRCHIDTGNCFDCKDGYQGQKCEHLCQNNTYGAGCSEDCGHCFSGQQCNHIFGTCPIGCDAGYYNDRCKTECPDGLYGINCLQICNANCYFKTCDKITGACQLECAVGWKPPLCNEECDDGTFGTNCSNVCGHCHFGNPCDKKTGECPRECDPGYEGLYCNQSCAQKYFGPDCNLTCSRFCFNQTCDPRSGVCLTPIEEKEDIYDVSSIKSVVGGSIGLAFMVVAVAVIIICRRNNISVCQCMVPGKLASKRFNRSSGNTSNMPKTNADMIESQYNEIDENIYDKIETELQSKVKNTYEQLLADIPLNDINVIINKGNDSFKREFASLSRDEQFPCDTAKLSVNFEKNRFHSSLPYDHSRVILRRYVGTSEDYINANYISGTERKNEYIATQGPLKSALIDFWEIVCQDQIEQIIILTNLTEQGKVKCDQYWPNNGITEIYGTVSVKSIEEKAYAFFTKRKLEVSQRGTKTYVVTQFHYTAWPDHGTPDPLCFVIFHHHVIHENANNGRSPTLVHCSTGTGRTGTFIALDYLHRTGKKFGRVNVAEYVKTMRRNRMNMIENYGQYKAVFLALHEAFKAEPVFQTKEEFLDTVSPMLKKSSAISSYIIREFELLKRICEVYSDEDYEQVDKSELYKPSNLPRRGTFIKASVVSTHKKENGFIITQYPPREEAVDFIRLLMDHECSTVICFDPLHMIESTNSWMPSPSLEKILPPYRVVHNSCKETDLKLSTIFIQKGEGELINILVAEPKSDLRSRTQNNTSALHSMVSFALSRPSNNTLAVVSRNDASLCGVFCAVYNSIQQITMDDNIDVFTTVRLLMTRRPELCSTEDEYSMIYHTIYDCLQKPSENVYHNQ